MLVEVEDYNVALSKVNAGIAFNVHFLQGISR